MYRIYLVLCVLLMSGSVFAQSGARITTMTFTRGQEQGRFTLSVLCDGQAQYAVSRSQLQIFDNDRPVSEYEIIESSSPAVHTPFSVALVMDVSGSMSGAPLTSAKAAADDFIQFMDSTADEAALLSFSSTVTLLQQMTSNKAALSSGVASLGAAGATAVYDGIYDGLAHVDANAINSKRAVLVLTDGADNSSVHSPADVIQYAQLIDVRVFVIALGGAVNATVMQNIAQATGGDYLAAPTAAQLQSLFIQVASFMGRGFDEHVVTMKSPDMHAATHELRVTVVVCPETVTAERMEAAMTSTSVQSAAAPLQLQLSQSAPNPAADRAVVHYAFEGQHSLQHVRLSVYDLLGREVAVAVDLDQRPGRYRADVDTRDLPSGVYFYRLQAGSNVLLRRMLVRH